MAQAKKPLLLLPAPKPDAFSEMKSWLVTILLALFLIGLLSQNFGSSSDIKKTIKQAQRWPQVPSSHFKLARILFLNGQEELAEKELKVGQQQIKRLKFLSLDFLFRREQENTQALVKLKPALSTQLEKINQKLEIYPYSWPLLLRKAVLEFRLYQQEQAQEAADLAFWLNPEGKQIQEVLKIVYQEE